MCWYVKGNSFNAIIVKVQSNRSDYVHQEVNSENE